MNDSGFRNTYWACYSTSLGSLLHELSHILDLGHNERGIMARGFDNLFTFYTINFKNCFCYQNLREKRRKNNLIERVLLRENELKNGSKCLSVKTETAMFRLKNNKEKLPKLEVIKCLKWNKMKLNSITNVALLKSGSNPNANCSCMMDCYYEENNLIILFNHKWLNQKLTNEDFDDDQLVISCLNGILSISALNGLILYEIRDKRANLLQFKYFKQPLLECSIQICKDFDLFNHNELFLLDTLGNIKKTKIIM